MSHAVKIAGPLLACLATLSGTAQAQSSYQFTELKPIAADAKKRTSIDPDAINNKGEVIGTVTKQVGYRFDILSLRFEPESARVPTIWSAAGGATELRRPSLPSGTGRYEFGASGLNNLGQVVGSAASTLNRSPITWKQNSPSVISKVAGQAFAVNDQGLIVGEVADPGQDPRLVRLERSNVALWRNGKLENLQPLVKAATGKTYGRAVDIDSTGRVLVEAFSQEYRGDAICLVIQQGVVTPLPIPEGYSCGQARFWSGNYITAILFPGCSDIPCFGAPREGVWLQGQAIEPPTMAQWIKAPITGLPANFKVSRIVDISENGLMLVTISTTDGSYAGRAGVLTPRP